jgi:uncharacterized protein YciW
MPDQPVTSIESDPVRSLEAVLAAARDYARFVIFKPDRPAAAARERLEAAIADYDEAFPAREVPTTYRTFE